MLLCFVGYVCFTLLVVVVYWFVLLFAVAVMVCLYLGLIGVCYDCLYCFTGCVVPDVMFV